MVSEKLLLNILKNFDGGISRADLILNTFHSDYDFNKHPEIEVNEAINVLISLGILKQHEHSIQGKIMGTSISFNLKETLRRLKIFDKIKYRCEQSINRETKVKLSTLEEKEGGL